MSRSGSGASGRTRSMASVQPRMSISYVAAVGACPSAFISEKQAKACARGWGRVSAARADARGTGVRPGGAGAPPAHRSPHLGQIVLAQKLVDHGVVGVAEQLVPRVGQPAHPLGQPAQRRRDVGRGRDELLGQPAARVVGHVGQEAGAGRAERARPAGLAGQARGPRRRAGQLVVRPAERLEVLRRRELRRGVRAAPRAAREGEVEVGALDVLAAGVGGHAEQLVRRPRAARAQPRAPARTPRPERAKKCGRHCVGVSIFSLEPIQSQNAATMPIGLKVEPSPDITFEVVNSKPSSCPLRLYNLGTEHTAFKVKTTAPKKYCVRPNAGVIAPGQHVEVHVIPQVAKGVDPTLANDLAGKCKDKFMIQSTPVQGDQPPSSELWAQVPQAELQQTLLRCKYKVRTKAAAAVGGGGGR